MAASSTASQVIATSTCETRTEELIRKIQELNSNLQSIRTAPEPSSASSKDIIASKETPHDFTSPTSSTQASSLIQIIYSHKMPVTGSRSPSPPPKLLTGTFPCPPEIPFPN